MLGHARGVAVLAAVQAGLPVVEYTPAEIKVSVVGYGRAEKAQVQRMIDAAARPRYRAIAARRLRRAGRGDLPRQCMPRPAHSRAVAPRVTCAAGGTRSPNSSSGARSRDRTSLRHAAREDTSSASSSTWVASATTFSFRFPRSTLSANPAQPIVLRIHTHVREDALQLYGFATPLEQHAVRAADHRQWHRSETGACGSLRHREW